MALVCLMGNLLCVRVYHMHLCSSSPAGSKAIHTLIKSTALLGFLQWQEEAAVQLDSSFHQASCHDLQPPQVCTPATWLTGAGSLAFSNMRMHTALSKLAMQTALTWSRFTMSFPATWLGHRAKGLVGLGFETQCRHGPGWSF